MPRVEMGKHAPLTGGRTAKELQIDVCLCEQVESASITNGFERYRLLHNALPELDWEEIDLKCEFLGRVLDYPLLLSPLTGGVPRATPINRNLAVAAQRHNVAMVVGSQKELLRNRGSASTYAVRDVAPDILLLGNLGADDLETELTVDDCRRAVEEIGADGLVLYLNPLQECFKPDARPRFRGVLAKIEKIVRALDRPVVVKEVGQGIGADVALRLREAGVAAVDVAGAGGTSWGIVEQRLSKAGRTGANPFDGWGIPTAEAVRDVRERLPDLPLVASGGIRNGVEIAKAIALGANLAGMALPLLRPAIDSAAAVERVIEARVDELKKAMFCVGARDLTALAKAPLVCQTAHSWQPVLREGPLSSSVLPPSRLGKRR